MNTQDSINCIAVGAGFGLFGGVARGVMVHGVFNGFDLLLTLAAIALIAWGGKGLFNER